MPHEPKIGSPRPLGDLLLASSRRFQRYRWVVFAAAVIVEVLVIWSVDRFDSTIHPLDPVGAGVVFVSVAAASVGGALMGLAVALVAVIASFALLADLSTLTAAANAIVSAFVWCAAAIAAGLVVAYFRRQVARREAALQLTLGRSLSARQQMERVLEFSPQLYQGGRVDETAAAICQAAVETFGADGARLYAIQGERMEMLALAPPLPGIEPGLSLSLPELPDIQDTLTQHRPSFVRDVRSVSTEGAASELRRQLGVVSTIRVPVANPAGPMGLLSLGWTHPIEQPAEDLLAIMQRFADQAAIAWQSALRAEAQRRVDELYDTLERVVTLAPSFHITGSPEEVAQAICEAALGTFGCTGAALYRVEGDRLRVLDHQPPLEELAAGRVFPLEGDSPPGAAPVSSAPTFIRDISDPSTCMWPCTPEITSLGGTRSLFYVPVQTEEHVPQHLLVLSWDRTIEEPDPGLMVVIERFADQAALALANASAERLHARLEASLRPTTPIDHPRLMVMTRYRTGEQRLHLGGDFVGSTARGETGLQFVIGDVSGHGPDAAALGATLRSTWKALVLAGAGVSEAVEGMRRMLLTEKTDPTIFATIVAGLVDVAEHEILLVNAGHLPPLLLADGRVTALEAEPSPPLGFDGSSPACLHRYPLPERWSLFLYTDGLIDVRVAPGSSQRYGEARLRERLAMWADTAPDQQAVDALMAEIESASGGHFADDVAVLVVSTKAEARVA